MEQRKYQAACVLKTFPLVMTKLSESERFISGVSPMKRTIIDCEPELLLR